MAMTCKVCRHKEKEAIDRLIVNGEPLRSIARQYGVSGASLGRHKEKCLVEKLKAVKQQENLNSEKLIRQIEHLQTKALNILAIAEKCGDLRTALQAIREARGNLELANKLMIESELEARVTELEKKLGGNK